MTCARSEWWRGPRWGAGARRSDRALPRFDAASRTSDLQLLPAIAFTPTRGELNTLRRVHDVDGVAVVRFYTVVPRGVPNIGLGMAAAVDSAFGNAVERARLITGRVADPAAPDEITIGEILAAQLHRGVGDHIDIASYSASQVAAAIAAGGGGRPGQPLGPRVRLRIVGIVRRPLDLSDVGAQGGIIVLTPAFHRKYSGVIGTLGVIVQIRTRHGAADVPSVVASARHIFGPSAQLSVSSSSAQTEGARNAIDVLTQALWIFAAVAALAGAVAIAIVLSREISLTSTHQATLHALGLTRPQRVMISGPTALFVAGGGALLGVLGAIAASPLFPFGVARRADPDIGLHADWLVLALGFIAAVDIAERARVSTATVDARRARGGRRRAADRDQRCAYGTPTRTRRVGDTCPFGAPRRDVRCPGRDGRPHVLVEPQPPRDHASPVRLDLGLQGRGLELQQRRQELRP